MSVLPRFTVNLWLFLTDYLLSISCRFLFSSMLDSWCLADPLKLLILQFAALEEQRPINCKSIFIKALRWKIKTKPWGWLYAVSFALQIPKIFLIPSLMIFPDNKSWTHFLSIEMAYLLVFSLPFSTEPFHNDTFRLYLFTLHFFYRLAGDQYCTIGYLDFIFKYPNTVRFLSIENYLSDLHKLK